MNKEIFNHYDAFYNMVLVCAGLTNTLDDAADEDERKIIAFIGEAYGLDNELIAFCQQKIVDELSAIGTVSDLNAFFALCEDGKVDKEQEELLSVKADALLALQAPMASRPYGVHEDWFSYVRRKAYFPAVRYSEIATAASSGLLICNKIAAVMAYLGIGTEQRVKGAVQRLRQCAFWGDRASVVLLAKVLSDIEDPKASVYADLIKLMPYLEEGYTVLPEEETKDIDVEAKKLFVLISSIRHDVILTFGRHAIDYSFVEVMTMDSIEYNTKLNCINNYNQGTWKNLTNPAGFSAAKIGFVLEEEDK